jgi:hypothetical protein
MKSVSKNQVKVCSNLCSQLKCLKWGPNKLSWTSFSLKTLVAQTLVGKALVGQTLVAHTLVGLTLVILTLVGQTLVRQTFVAQKAKCPRFGPS